MALSEQEQKMLAEIEQALIAEDPRFAKRASKAESGGVSFNIRSVALIMLGLVGLIGGIALAQTSLWFVVLSLFGFIVMFVGGLMAFRGGAGGAVQRNAGKNKKKSPKSSPRQGGIGDKMEDSFRRRFER